MNPDTAKQLLKTWLAEYNNIFDLTQEDLSKEFKENFMATYRSAAPRLSSVQAKDAIGKYIVVSVNGSTFSAATDPVLHMTPASARSECRRLSNLNPGITYMFLQVSGGELKPANTVSF